MGTELNVSSPVELGFPIMTDLFNGHTDVDASRKTTVQESMIYNVDFTWTNLDQAGLPQ